MKLQDGRIRINSPYQSGVHVPVDAEPGLGQTYVPVLNDNSRLVDLGSEASGGPYVYYDNSGRRYFYGLIQQGDVTFGQTFRAGEMRYYLADITDRFGRRVTFRYGQTPELSAQYLTQIQYNYPPEGGSARSSIDLEYEPNRPDPGPATDPRLPVTLTKVSARHNNDRGDAFTSTGCWELSYDTHVRTGRRPHDTWPQFTLLDSISEYASDLNPDGSSCGGGKSYVTDFTHNREDEHDKDNAAHGKSIDVQFTATGVSNRDEIP